MPDTKDQNTRITRYEAMLDEVTQLLSTDPESDRLPVLIKELEAYYTSDAWKQDYADDEAGLLPADLKRGVLSEDAVYDLITDNHELAVRMLKTVVKALENQAL